MTETNTDADAHWMRHALTLAQRGLYTTTPNPRVGCVLVRAGEVVGEGWHQWAGQAHAEAMALAQAGERARGATAYVTLEPCSHVGRTPPCAEALVQAGVARVVAAMQDPNPQVQGQGFARLRAAGITVHEDVLAEQARALNRGFISRMTRQRPWVRLKTAASLDGLIALPDGRSQWITGAAARADGHHWRAQACAIMTGRGTVQADNPRLDVRECATPRQPLKVLLDSQLTVAPDAQLFAGAPVWIFCLDDAPAKADALRARGCEVHRAPAHEGRIDLLWVMRHLAVRGINEIHVEAGSVLGGALVQAGLVDEWLMYWAPTLLGAGRPLLELAPPADLASALRWRLTEITPIEPDWRIIARPEAAVRLPGDPSSGACAP